MEHLEFAIVALTIALAGCSTPQPEGSIYCVTGEVGSGRICEIEAATGELKRIINTSGDDIRPEVLGKEVFFGSIKDGDTTIYRVIVTSGEIEAVTDTDSIARVYSDSVFSGPWTAFIDCNRRVLWIPKVGAAPVPVGGERVSAAEPALSYSAGLLAYSSIVPDKKDRVIIVKKLPDGRIAAVFDTESDDIAPNISSDGLWLVFQSGYGPDAHIAVGYIPDGNIEIIAKGRFPCWGYKEKNIPIIKMSENS